MGPTTGRSKSASRFVTKYRARSASRLLESRSTDVSTDFVVIWAITLLIVSVAADISVGIAMGRTPSQTPISNGNSTDSGSPMTADTRPDASASVSELPEPDHGLNATTFPKLWSGDPDEPRATYNDTVQSVVLSATDFAFVEPPQAVEKWNSGDHGEFPGSGIDRSVYPPDAHRSGALWIEDAYIEVFALQPSTVAHVGQSDTRHYISRSGRVLGTTDYRIDLPDDVTRDFDPPSPDPGEEVLLKKEIKYEVIDHGRSDITLEADGDRVASTGPTRTPRLEFSALDQSTDQLSLEVTVSATFEKTTRRKYRLATRDCDTRTIWVNNTTRRVTDCHIDYDTHWSKQVDRPSRQVTVRDTIDVDIYELAPTASKTAFTDGQSALVVEQREDNPWASYELPSGQTVQNIWHFYATRDPDWDSLIAETESGTSRIESDSIPLQVHAFPSGGGAYAQSRYDEFEVSQVWGPRRAAPTLTENVTLPTINESYSTGLALATRLDSGTSLDQGITVNGLVRGTQSQTSVRSTRSEQATSLDLELLRKNRSNGTVTVRVALRESPSGRPIDLRPRPGNVTVHGIAAETNASGVAVVTAPLVGPFVSAEYQPGPWWETTPIYDAASARIDFQTEWPDPLKIVNALSTLIVWLSPILLVIYLLDRLLGRGRIWPPWRGIQ